MGKISEWFANQINILNIKMANANSDIMMWAVKRQIKKEKKRLKKYEDGIKQQ